MSSSEAASSKLIEFSSDAYVLPDNIWAMEILRVKPELVGGTASLVERLAINAFEAGASESQIDELLKALPPGLGNAQCFFDKLTTFWRYEFGTPFYLESQKQLLWGAHMWVPVQYLRRALTVLLNRVPGQKRVDYLGRLDNPSKHFDALSEMMPLLHVAKSVTADFEVVGRGCANRTIDWLLTPAGDREILFDVKSRSTDLIQQMDKRMTRDDMPDPNHDASLIFRSVEKKFRPAARTEVLQGVWIATHIKQERTELSDAFAALSPDKVHFAIMGRWEDGAYILVRDELDRAYILEKFGLIEVDDFTFVR